MGRTIKKVLLYQKNLFATSPVFNITAFVICVILAVLYSLFW